MSTLFGLLVFIITFWFTAQLIGILFKTIVGCLGFLLGLFVLFGFFVLLVGSGCH